MQRSKLVMGGADAGAGGMSISSSSAGASGKGASSSPYVASAMAQSTGSSGAGSGSMCLEKSSSREWSAAASVTASRNSALLTARKRCHPVIHAVEDGAGKRGACLSLDAALEAAEDGHVAGLQVRRAVRREEREHDVRECGAHGGQGGLAGVDAGHVPEEDPRLSLSAWIEHVFQSGRELQDRGRRGPAVLRGDVMSALRPGLLGQDGVCLARVHDLHQHVQRSTAHAEGDRERRRLPRVALRLRLFHAAAAQSSLMHWEEAARGLVNVDYAVCADSMHSLMKSRCVLASCKAGLWSSFEALGGLLEAQAHATHESLHPALAGMHVEPLCVEPLEYQAVDRDRAQAQDVDHLHDVLVQPCHVCG